MSNIETEWLSGAKLAAMLGVTSMTVWRWEQNDKLAFPRPTIINGRKYWHRDAINNWMRAKAVAKAEKGVA
jgi:predicted DNA-binding transcriptional regulator AlpA